MGIQNLLVLLKPAMYNSSLRQFSGQTAVIDIMGWLYRGAFSDATLIGTENSLGFMGFPFKMLKLLLQSNIKPICVFDGRPHDGKLQTEKERSKFKAKNKEMAEQAQAEGDQLAARKFNTRALFIKSKQIDLVMEMLDLLGLEHITAPYEADAQMAYMVKEGFADFAITEDSDLIAFGCNRVFLKMNYAGYG